MDAVKSATVTMMMMMMMMMMMVALSGAVPTEPPNQEEQNKAQNYLSQFFSDVGVSPPNSVLRSSLDSFEDTLKKMQEYYGLEVTGELDSDTLEMMERPRCGFTDVIRYRNFDGGPRWDKRVITYRVTDYTTDLSHGHVDAVLSKALKLYSDVTPLLFKKIDSGTADIMIKFKAGAHGDFSPFDGPQGVLAHAFSPGEGHGGDAHFDEDETWTLTSEGSNLFSVAAHEFGHALGLAHSQLQTALMFPTYQYVNAEGYQLPEDDKKGVQALYGVGGSPDPEPSPPSDPEPSPPSDPEPSPPSDPEPSPPSDPEPNRCDTNFNFDAASLIQGNLYFFKDGYVWKKSRSWDGIRRKKISSVWSGITNVDAVYEYKRDNLVFIFKGAEYWGFRGNAVLPGFPKAISLFGFPSSVTKVDAAVHVSFTRKTLFFVNNKYWSYDERRGRMDAGYPKFIHREFPGIGSRVDAAFENRERETGRSKNCLSCPRPMLPFSEITVFPQSAWFTEDCYLYFTHGHRQTEYHYSRRRALRTMLNNRWMDCE